MPPPRSRSSKSKFFNVDFVKELLFDPNRSKFVIVGLFIFEIFLNVFIIKKINYTEIDWIAYMQEVEGVVNGTFDYSELKGDTGPLVYPAGFVYVYLILYYVTQFGKNIRLGQLIFVGIYLTLISAVFYIYYRVNKVPPYAYVVMCFLAYRIHSIFVLRLFNDPIAMTFLYISIVFLLHRQWTIACLLYSLAVSIKMNILLMAPGLFIVLLLSVGLRSTIRLISYCAALQFVLAIPFLWTNPIAYIVRSFDLGRQFFYIWTVNWRCISEEIFLNRWFHLGLLALHLIVLLYVCCFQWLKQIRKINELFTFHQRFQLSSDAIVTIMFYSNFIGICFCRSLHYQFYVWYYHMLIHLFWSTKSPSIVNLIFLVLIEFSWNTYPSTMISSSILHLSHLYLLIQLIISLKFELNTKKTKRMN